jgi:large subunit ribosomal protein L18
MIRKNVKESTRFRRKRRIRKKIYGTAERPRLTVYRSNEHIYAQIVNDVEGHTVVSASTIDKALRDQLSTQKKAEAAHEVGKSVATRAKEKGYSQVVFDRNGYLYHGRVAAVANGAREGGLEF